MLLEEATCPSAPEDLSGEADLRSEFSFQRELAPSVRELSRLRPQHAFLALLVDWAIIASCFALALFVPHPLVWVAAAVVIACRQHALLILMHEAAHYRLLAGRSWADRLSNWFMAYPLLVTTAGYRSNHLAHHFHLNTEDDPDWMRKLGRPQWSFPKTRWGLMKLLTGDLLGRGLLLYLGMILHVTHLTCAGSRRAALRLAVEATIYYGLVVTAITLADLWLPVLLLWLVPMVTVLPAMMRVRSMAEHFGLPGQHELNKTRNVLCPAWERFLIAPHGINYHLDHHLFPSVPYYQLPRLHALLLQHPEYREAAWQNDSYFGAAPTSVWSDLTKPTPTVRRSSAVPMGMPNE